MEIDLQVKLSLLYCASCSIPFAFPKDFEDRRRADHRSFYCPHGHTNVFDAETEAERLRKRLREQTLAKERAERETEEARKAAVRIKHRVAAGTCPCCQRTFKQLAAHMNRKHPDYA